MKRYYWLKLKKEFFKQKTIKKIRKLPGGETHLVIFLEMLTLTSETDGVIVYEGIEKSPEEELALALDEDVDAVRMTVNLLRMLNLLEDCSNGNYFLPDAVKMTGSESESAERMRRLRQKNKSEDAEKIAGKTTILLPSGSKKNGASHCDADVTQAETSHCDAGVTQKMAVLSRTIPNNASAKTDSQKVKISIEAAQTLGSEKGIRENCVTLCGNVRNSDEHKEKELEKNEDMLLTNQPSNKYSSNIKSAVYSNNNFNRANARVIEEKHEETSTQNDSNKYEGNKSLDGWMEKANKNSLSESEVEGLFQKFMKEYPRPTKRQGDAKNVFKRLVFDYGVDPYDLVDSAVNYAKHVLEQKTPERFVKMPQNFLAELTWQKHMPTVWKRCPKCHGAAYYEGKDGYIFCDCNKRYSQIPVLTNII